MKLLVGSANKGKLIEIGEALSSLDVEIVSPADVGITDVPEEHGATYEENARAKALFYYAQSNLPTLADDSGIVVDALKDELGVHTRRWGKGKDASDEEWIAYFLERMGKEDNRRARFVCTLAYIDETGTENLFTGSCDGTITTSVEAPYLPGLPISSCFRPDGFETVYSALTVAQKNSVSHRGRAMSAFKKFLEQR